MKVQITIQARLASSRLPNKIFAQVGKYPIIVHILKRIFQLSFQDIYIKIITPREELEEIKNRFKVYYELFNHQQIEKIQFFGGSLYNVLDRFIQSAEDLSDDDYLVRLTSDNPFLAYDLLDENLKKIIKSEKKIDYSYPYGLPLGMGFEIIRLGILRSLKNTKLKNYHKEHVTIAFREKPENYHILVFPKFENPLNKKVRLTIDEKKDLEMSRNTYQWFHSQKQSFFSYEDIFYLYEKNPGFFYINNSVRQKSATEAELEEAKKKRFRKFETAQLILLTIWGKNALMYSDSKKKDINHGLGHLYRMKELRDFAIRNGIQSVLLKSNRHNYADYEINFASAKIVLLDARDDSFPNFFIHKKKNVFLIAMDNRGKGRENAHYVWDSIPHFGMNLRQLKKSLKHSILPVYLSELPHSKKNALFIQEKEAMLTDLIKVFSYPPKISIDSSSLIRRIYESDIVKTHFGLTMLIAVYFGKKIIIRNPGLYHKKLADYFISYYRQNKELHKILDGKGMNRLLRFIQRLIRR